MSIIKSNTDLRDDYSGISALCHECSEPVYITEDGKANLVVMSIEAYEQLIGKFELYKLIGEGMDDIQPGQARPFSEALSYIRGIK